MITLILLFLSISVNVALGWATLNLVKKQETYEDFFETLQNKLVRVLDQMKSIDIRGAFEAEDEVGLVFSGLKNMVYTLNEFVVADDDNQDADPR